MAIILYSIRFYTDSGSCPEKYLFTREDIINSVFGPRRIDSYRGNGFIMSFINIICSRFALYFRKTSNDVNLFFIFSNTKIVISEVGLYYTNRLIWNIQTCYKSKY